MPATRLWVLFFCLLSAVANAQTPRLVCPVWHGNDIKYTEFSPDQKMVLTLGEDKLVKIWSAANGELLQTIQVHPEEVYTAHFSPDSKKILTASRDSTAKLWDIASRSLLQTFRGLPHRDGFALFTRDGRSILTNSVNHFAILWDAYTGKQLKIFERRGKDIPEMGELSRDGKYVLFSFADSAGVWETSTGRFLHAVPGDIYQGASVLSSDGRLVATKSSEQTTQYIVWETATGKIVQRLQAEKPGLYSCLQFSPDNKKLLGLINDRELGLWDIGTGAKDHSFIARKGRHSSAVFDPGGGTILVASRGNVVSLWDTRTGKLIDDAKITGENVFKALFSPDGTKILIANLSSPASVWDTRTKNHLYDMSAVTSAVSDAFFSPDGSFYFSYSYDMGWRKWETTSGRQIPLPFNNTVQFFDFSKQGDWMLYADSLLHIADQRTGKTQYLFSWDIDPKGYHFNKGGQWIQGLENGIGSLSEAFQRLHPMGTTIERIETSSGSQPNKTLLSIGGKELSDVWDISQFSMRLPGSNRKWFMDWQKQFSPDNKYFLTTSNDERIILWNAADGTFLRTLSGHATWPVMHADFSKDGRQVVSGGYDGNIIVWDVSSGTALFNLTGHQDAVRSTRFNADGTRIISTSADGQIRIWNKNNRNELFSFLVIDSINFFQLIPSGYYQTTTEAAKLLHYVTKDLKVLSFEQLDVKYNRPDKVLQAIGSTDSVLIRSYRKAWEKRIKKLGIDTAAFTDGYSVPEADFVNRDAVVYEQQNETLQLHIKAVDSSYKLDRYNVWINEVPVFGQRGISIRNKNSNKLDTRVRVKLSGGVNRIETSITNVNGTESYRIPLFVNYTPVTSKKETVRFIGIGIDRFSDNRYDLQYSSKDIRDLSKKLKEKYGSDIAIDTLFNENVSISSVKALKQKLLQTTENDKVIVAYSGHGMLSKDYDYYLSTYSVNFDKPEDNGLPYDELENLLDSIPARKKLMLIDACHSGEVDKEDLVTLSESPDSLIKGLKPVAYKKDGQLGLKNSFELMQSLFVNVGKSTGATIISAAAGTQFALERNDLKNGVFTYSILEAMNKYPTLKISELKKIVGERVEQLTKGLQKPTSRNETIAVDWEIW